MYGYNGLRKDGGLLSPKVTNNIAQGKAASVATLGIMSAKDTLPEGEQQISVDFIDHVLFTSVARNVFSKIGGTRQN
jgi:hypothetical protein